MIYALDSLPLEFYGIRKCLYAYLFLRYLNAGSTGVIYTSPNSLEMIGAGGERALGITTQNCGVQTPPEYYETSVSASVQRYPPLLDSVL